MHAVMRLHCGCLVERSPRSWVSGACGAEKHRSACAGCTHRCATAVTLIAVVLVCRLMTIAVGGIAAKAHVDVIVVVRLVAQQAFGA